MHLVMVELLDHHNQMVVVEEEDFLLHLDHNLQVAAAVALVVLVGILREYQVHLAALRELAE